MDMPQRHSCEEPAAKPPEVEAVAKTPRRDGYEFTAGPQHFRGVGQEQRIDIRLPVNYFGHEARMDGIASDLEVGRVHDHRVEATLRIVVVKQGRLTPSSARSQDKILLVDREVQSMTVPSQRRLAVQQVLIEKRNQG